MNIGAIRMERDNLRDLLGECLCYLKLALRGQQGAFANALYEEDIPRFERASAGINVEDRYEV